ncbi:MAG: V-type ATP synthase subunit F [Clostridiales bacterium]|nr:V-type ATP synthase subunit F [Clostridiales bacterium]
MYSVAVLGDRESVLGFKALGLDVFFAENAAEGRAQLAELTSGNYAVIYITETLAAELAAEIEHNKDAVIPAIILIPGKAGSLGIGMNALRSSVERAVGMDIFGNQ